MRKYIILLIWIITISLLTFFYLKPIDNEKVTISKNYDDKITELGISTSIPYQLKELITTNNLEYIGKFSESIPYDFKYDGINSYLFDYENMKTNINALAFKSNNLLNIFVTYDKNANIQGDSHFILSNTKLPINYLGHHSFISYKGNEYLNSTNSYIDSRFIIPNTALSIKNKHLIGYHHFTLDILNLSNYVIDINIYERKPNDSIDLQFGFNSLRLEKNSFYIKQLSFINIKERL